MLSVTRTGIHLCDPKSKDQSLKSWSYQQLVTWGGSKVKLIIVVGTITQNRKLTFLTSEAQVIAKLLLDYVSQLLRAVRSPEA